MTNTYRIHKMGIVTEVLIEKAVFISEGGNTPKSVGSSLLNIISLML